MMVVRLVTLNKVIEVPAGVEHGLLPDDLPGHADHTAQVGHQPQADPQLGQEVGQRGVLGPGDHHGHPVLHAVVHQEAVPGQVLGVAQARRHVLGEVEE